MLAYQSVQVPANDLTPEVIKSNGMNGFSIFWGGLVRIDVLKVVFHTLFFMFVVKR